MNNIPKITEILNSLDGMQRAEANPFMYTRVIVRIQHEKTNIWSRIGVFITKPVIAFCCLATIIAANIYYIVNSEQKDISSPIATIEALPDIQTDFIMAMNNNEMLNQ